VTNNFFFNHDNNFINTIYAANIAIENHFANYLLNSELDRVVYASNSYALRKRSNKTPWDVSFLPFMNYEFSDLEDGTDRPIWNSSAKIRGSFLKELGKSVRFTPITINYEASVWYNQPLDNLFALTEVIWDNTNETILDFFVNMTTTDGDIVPVKLFAILGYNFSYNPQYNQSDWLTENKINTIGLNFEIQTYLLKDDVSVSIPEEVVFNFAYSKGLNPTEWDSTQSFFLDYSDYRS